MDGRLPFPEGWSGRLDFYPRDVSRARLLEPTASPLVEQTKEFAFFTTALLFAYGGIEHDPIREYVEVHRQTVNPFVYVYAKPFLSGLDPQMCRTLCGVPISEWPSLLDFLLRIAAVDHQRRFFFQAGAQQVRIADPVFLDKGVCLPDAGCPSIEITAFGVDSNAYQIGFAPARRLPLDQPFVVKYPARAATKRLADSIFAGAVRPYRNVEQVTPLERRQNG